MTNSPKSPEKTRLHPRNKNRELYDLKSLVQVEPMLSHYIQPNRYGEDSVNYADPEAVRLLNKALIHHYYGIKNWDFPKDNLCPPIPGRADYIHYMADLLSQSNYGKIPVGENITGLDIGVGATCIYPIIGATEYGWSFTGSDISSQSIENAQRITASNVSLQGKIECRLQKNPRTIFKGILERNEKIDFTICNPPFHSSADEAQKGTQRKVQNLSGKKTAAPVLNFSGINNELVYPGGELAFIRQMIQESRYFAANCFWFSTLVSKSSNLKRIDHALQEAGIEQTKTIPLGTGNKISRIVAWSFLSKAEQKEWRETRWRIPQKK